MLDTLKTIAVATALLVPATGIAQEAQPESQAEEQPQAPAATDLATGTDVKPAEPEVISEAFGDWTVNCQQIGEAERCQMYQLLRDQDDNPVVEVNLFRVSDQPQVFAGGTVVVPLETLLTPQLTIAVDEALGKRYPFAFCLPNGCVSRIGLTEEDVAGYKRGSKATVSIVPAAAPDRTVTLNMSLTGFTKAFDRLPE